MKSKNILLFILILFIVCVISAYIRYAYLYNPLAFPRGNLTDFRRNWSDFKNPISVEAYSWEKGMQTIYIPIENDIDTSRFVIDNFAKFNKINNYSYERYLTELPKNRGAEYTILVRQVNKTRDGNILLQFSFFENSNIAQIDGVHFYSVSNDFKKTIMNRFTTKD